MFDKERFIADCLAAVREDDSHKAVAEVVAAAAEDPNAILSALGEPSVGGVEKLFNSDELTIINVVWPPWMTIMPHNHEMWAVIGVYTGCEDNIFWRRVPDAKDGHVEAAGARSLRVTDTAPLGRDIIHSVNNPIPRLTGAIHVYGGDFFTTPRNEWDAETLTEQAYDIDKNMRLFEEFGARG